MNWKEYLVRDNFGDLWIIYSYDVVEKAYDRFKDYYSPEEQAQMSADLRRIL